MKTEHIVLSSRKTTHLPKFNGFGCGYGRHRSIKDYDRKRSKRELRKELFSI